MASTSAATFSTSTSWNGSGGGLSAFENLPAYQATYGLSYAQRAIPDVAMVADPKTGVATYDSEFGGWLVVGGTSAAAPLWVGVLADADSGRILAPKPTMKNADEELYPVATSFYATDFHDITTGSSGGACIAQTNYDLVTGHI